MVIAGFCATGAHPAAAHVAAAITVKYFLFTTVSLPQGIRRGADTMPERVTEKRRSNDDATQQSCYTAGYRFAPLRETLERRAISAVRLPGRAA